MVPPRSGMLAELALVTTLQEHKSTYAELKVRSAIRKLLQALLVLRKVQAAISQ